MTAPCGVSTTSGSSPAHATTRVSPVTTSRSRAPTRGAVRQAMSSPSPRTWAEEDDPLDVLVLGQEPVVPLCIVQARAIGGFRMRDDRGIDVKLICVHVNDPAFADYQAVDDLPRHVVAEMMRFFKDYKT